MLIDRFDRIEEYYKRIPHLSTAVEFIRSNDNWKPGRYEFEGGYILYQELETKAYNEGSYENHRFFNDIQVLLEGDSWHTFWNRVEEMQSIASYDVDKDAERWDGEGADIRLKPGMFVCFFPCDAHKPDRYIEGEAPEFVKKYVIKLRTE